MGVDAASGRAVVPTSYDHSVSILAARSGRVLRTLALDQGTSGDGLPTGALAVAVDARTGRAFVATAETGTVGVLDVRTGSVLRTIAVGVHPLAIAVAERTDRAFVVTGGGTVTEAAGWWRPWMQRLRRWLPWLPQQPPPTNSVPGSVTVLDLARL